MNYLCLIYQDNGINDNFKSIQIEKQLQNPICKILLLVFECTPIYQKLDQSGKQNHYNYYMNKKFTIGIRT